MADDKISKSNNIFKKAEEIEEKVEIINAIKESIVEEPDEIK
jgi:radical SAM superfamily enzyme with C-terminal helix-hairpin-helix motif